MMKKISRSTLHALRTALEQPNMDQGHLFEHWPDTADAYDDSQLSFLEELYAFDSSYRGGVTQYVRTARHLLTTGGGSEESMLQLRMPQHIVHAPSLYVRTPELQALERVGEALLSKTVFVLVAGGLGERLGCGCIKVGLPVETATQVTYLEHYLQWAQQGGGLGVPFVIMTSDDTHASTVELLRHIPCAQAMTGVRLLKQETVPCLSDNDAHLTLDAAGRLVRKPHGHGDIHSLIYTAKTIPDGNNNNTTNNNDTNTNDNNNDNKNNDNKNNDNNNNDNNNDNNNGGKRDDNKLLTQSWIDAGYEYVCFFQDTNATATSTIPLSLAVSARENWAMNFTCISRQPQEAIGLLCDVRMRLRDTEDKCASNRHTSSSDDASSAADSTLADSNGVWVTRNIEYNVFETVARALTTEGGDVAVKGSRYSPYPGSINTLLCQLVPYVNRVQATCGTVPEFINPKYADSSRRAFKKPARVESLMQDLALLFANTDYRVGGTVFDRFSCQPVKNHMDDAVVKARANQRPYCPTTGEADFYEFMRRRVRAVGVDVPTRNSNQDDEDGQDTSSNNDAAAAAAAAGEGANHETHEESVDLVVGGAIKVTVFPIVTLNHTAAGRDTLSDLQRVFPHPAQVHVSARSTLIVEGHVVIESLQLDGALRVCGPSSSEQAPLVVRDLVVSNAHWGIRAIAPDDTDEVNRVRGFVLVKTPMTVVAEDGTVTDESSKL